MTLGSNRLALFLETFSTTLSHICLKLFAFGFMKKPVPMSSLTFMPSAIRVAIYSFAKQLSKSQELFSNFSQPIFSQNGKALLVAILQGGTT